MGVLLTVVLITIIIISMCSNFFVGDVVVALLLDVSTGTVSKQVHVPRSANVFGYLAFGDKWAKLLSNVL